MGALGEERGRKRNVGGGFGGTPKEEEKEEEKEVCPTKRARAHITIFSSSIFAPFIIFLFLFSVILTFKLPGEKAWKDETAAFLSLFLFLLRLMDRVSVIGFGHLSLSPLSFFGFLERPSFPILRCKGGSGFFFAFRMLRPSLASLIGK